MTKQKNITARRTKTSIAVYSPCAIVIAGLGPAIHVLLRGKDVDARIRGHDGEGSVPAAGTWAPRTPLRLLPPPVPAASRASRARRRTETGSRRRSGSADR